MENNKQKEDIEIQASGRSSSTDANNKDEDLELVKLLEFRIQELENKVKGLKDAEDLAYLFNKHKFIVTSIVFSIIWLILHCWSSYKEFNDDRFNLMKENLDTKLLYNSKITRFNYRK
ncbi:MAG: hypothetical protein LBL16_04170 [Endomicrobium sp.]|jgi:hypothetical protein|nr:hypothetical protein [Endomicrobium sp.]